ncbi:hypothetical protein Q0N12_10270 [Rossellomorea marisflavi]|uniref:hypothetical protein n=1 Tax=Rossellomorea marisflavi TaxID=189381 RepID=UPI003458E280
MKKWVFHSLNGVVVGLLTVFNVLASFGNAMSAVSSPRVYFAVITSYLIWALFYGIQAAKTSAGWRLAWFIVSLFLLVYWAIGGGSRFYEAVVG